MKGQTLEDAKRAVGMCLSNLPPNALFNIIDFGSRYERLFVDSVQISPWSKSTAFKHINNLKASFAGTNLRIPLKSLFTLSKKGKLYGDVSI
jgi:hypothetical protein